MRCNGLGWRRHCWSFTSSPIFAALHDPAQHSRWAATAHIDRCGADVLRALRSVVLFVLREGLAPRRPRQCRRIDRTSPAAAGSGFTALGRWRNPAAAAQGKVDLVAWA